MTKQKRFVLITFNTKTMVSSSLKTIFISYKILNLNTYSVFSFHFLAIIILSYNVLSINEKVLDSIFSVVSILFPLIAGFLTFGRDYMNNLKIKIKKINTTTSSKSGLNTSDVVKNQIRKLKETTENFQSVVLSTCLISFLLILFILIVNFNSYNFESYTIDYNQESILEYLELNVVSLLLKTSFFMLLSLLFMNLAYSIYFINSVYEVDEFLME